MSESRTNVNDATPLSPDAIDLLNDGEKKFDLLRRRVGFVAAPSLFVAILLMRFPSLTPEAHRLAAIMPRWFTASTLLEQQIV